MDNMKEKEYSTIEEEIGCMTAAEPIGSSIYAPIVDSKPSRTIPLGVPSTIEMAIADIEEGEREFERNETFSHKEVMQMVWNKIASYAG